MSEPEEHEKDGSPIKPGMTKTGPRWTIAFLRALERTGDARASAEDAGVDHTTAYLRRRSHADFALAWDAARQAHAALVGEEQAAEVELLRAAPPPHVVRSPSPRNLGEDMVGPAQVRRAGHDRWSGRKEKLFFAELAASANVKRAAKAAGVSPNAVYQRRMRDAHFKAKWAAVLETGRAAIEMQMIERARKSFDPDELDTGDIEPKVSVAEALKIIQQGPRTTAPADYDPFAEQAAAMSEEDVHELRERVLSKIGRLKERTERERLEEGWSRDEATGHIVPPGWVRAGG